MIKVVEISQRNVCSPIRQKQIYVFCQKNSIWRNVKMNVSKNGNTDHKIDICEHILTHALSFVLFMTFALCFGSVIFLELNVSQ